MFRIFVDAFNRTDHHALRLIEMADAFSTALMMDDVDVFALGDGLIRASRFADITVDAKLVDFERHGFKQTGPAFARPLCPIQSVLLDFFDEETTTSSLNYRFHALSIF